MYKTSPTFRMLAKVSNLTLLVLFAVLSAGGSGLHYAPFLGLHQTVAHRSQEERSDQTEKRSTVSNCGCGHLHLNTRPDGTPVGHSQLREANIPEGHAGCDGHCAFCRYFSEIHLQSDLATVLSQIDDLGEQAAALKPTATSLRPNFSLARGPPVA